jgi:hypothetical protein
MKVNANLIHTLAEGASALHGARASAKTSNAAPAPAAAPVESTVTLSAKKIPPGLQRVAARLESLGVEGRSPGQSNALSQINRNLQRYVDTQALALAPAPAPADAVALPAETTTGAIDITGSASVSPALVADAQLA